MRATDLSLSAFRRSNRQTPSKLPIQTAHNEEPHTGHQVRTFWYGRGSERFDQCDAYFLLERRGGQRVQRDVRVSELLDRL